MTVTEFLIVYLSIGAPFGVYFFLNHRTYSFAFLIKAIAAALFWCFYAGILIVRRSDKFTKTQSASDSNGDSKVEQATRTLLALYSEIPASGKNIPFFDFRETVERYIGLTSALNDAAQSSFYENEVFKIGGRANQDLSLANVCLQRKNLRRLKLHQQQARIDFIKFFENLAGNIFAANSDKKLLTAAVILTDLIADEEGKTILNRIKTKIEKQNPQNASSSTREKEVWNTLQPEQITILHTQSSAFNLTVKAQD